MKEIEKILLELDPKNPASHEKIAKVYLLLDEACDSGKIDVNELILLLDRVIMLKNISIKK